VYIWFMRNKLQVSIPTQCHENWQDMTVADKGRFCVSCQKHVIDFTTSSDRQIAEAHKKEANLCGRFLHTQLNRDLVITKEKSKVWIAASAAVVAFFTLGNYKVYAQVPMEQVESKINTAKNTAINSNILVTGRITDSENNPIPEAIVTLDEMHVTHTDEDGKFSIYANTGDTLSIKFVGFENSSIRVGANSQYNVILEEKSPFNNGIFVGAVVTTKNRTFFGRIFHSIGNIFR